jgi:poly(3-hydroxybutyrate) depolymerase
VGGTGTPGNYPLKNPPVKSSGCGTDGMQALLSGATAVANGLATSKRVKITSSGESREYIIDIPANYDKSKPYRLFYTSHWIGSTDTAVATGSVTNGGAANWGYYGLHREAMAANDPAIFVAPQSQGSTWQQKDHPLFDDILAKVSSSLCIDTSRVFATGFSFGGMITYSLSTNHQKQIRAAVGIAPANYNIYLPNPIPRDPIAWMSTTGMGDGTCPYDGGNNRGAKYIATGRAQDNGCTAATIPTWTSGSPARHVCYDYQGCKSNYPLKVCTFNGGHQAAPHDAGGGDNGLTSWIPSESWKFFTQF